jgi:ethanolamine utilization protein EutQ (cupin superfamily)
MIFFTKKKRKKEKKKERKKMGQANSHVKRKYSGELYFPVSAHVGNMEDDLNKKQVTPKQRKIANHGIAGIWSMFVLKDSLIPTCRTNFFYVTDEATSRMIIGFGTLNDGSLTNELYVFDMDAFEWQRHEITGDNITPRAGSKAVIIGNRIVVFGGKDELKFLNELISIDMDTFVATRIKTTGDEPTPRVNCVIGAYNNKLAVWGGYDGALPNDLYILDLQTFVWHKKEFEITGRDAASFVQEGKYIYVCGASKATGLVIIDIEKERITHHETVGAEPLSTMTNAGLVKACEYLIFIGGKSLSHWSTVNALDIVNKTWFLVHVRPDGKTVSEADGNITETGVFMIPRTHSMAISFDSEKRVIYTCLGSPMFDPAPIYSLELGEAISVIHLRDDLLTIFHQCENGDVDD